MAELICNTSVIQSLHQLGLLHLLPVLASPVCVPAAVEAELAAGRASGADVPEPAAFAWARKRTAESTPSLPREHALGAGERAVLWLAMESATGIAVLDDRDARRVARRLGIPLTGTLGLLVDAKQRGLIPAVAPLLNELGRRGFHMSGRIREAVLKRAGEE